jgi:ubiquinone/menaquinone biosynthesis C-methylase UbiE
MVNYGSASKYYDLFSSKNDIAFYRELAIRHGRKALELGVGTGRVAIELAKTGVVVWGIDNSKYMLAVAKQKLAKESTAVRKRVTLKLGDMRNFKLKETFPFIYIASSTFEHCVTEEDQQKCLMSAYKALGNGGVLAFDISQPTKEAASSWWVDRRQLDKRDEVVRTILSRRNPKTSVVSVNLFFDVYRKGILKERYYEYGEARLSSKGDVERILKSVDFAVQKIYGDFDKSAYSRQSQTIIFICSKR